MAFVPVTAFTGSRVRGSSAAVSVRPARAAKWTMDGKGFGGGEATRDPKPHDIDPNDPKAREKAIHPCETFAEYTARVAAEKAAAEKGAAEKK